MSCGWSYPGAASSERRGTVVRTLYDGHGTLNSEQSVAVNSITTPLDSRMCPNISTARHIRAWSHTVHKNANTVSNHLLVCTNNWLWCPVYDNAQISKVNVTRPSKLQYLQAPNKAVTRQLCHYQTTCLSSTSLKKHHTNVYRNTKNILNFTKSLFTIHRVSYCPSKINSAYIQLHAKQRTQT